MPVVVNASGVNGIEWRSDLGLLNAGAGLSEAPDAAGLPDFATWDQYDTIHRRNASIVYIRLERELLYK